MYRNSYSENLRRVKLLRTLAEVDFNRDGIKEEHSKKHIMSSSDNVRKFREEYKIVPHSVFINANTPDELKSRFLQLMNIAVANTELTFPQRSIECCAIERLKGDEIRKRTGIGHGDIAYVCTLLQPMETIDFHTGQMLNAAIALRTKESSTNKNTWTFMGTYIEEFSQKIPWIKNMCNKYLDKKAQYHIACMNALINLQGDEREKKIEKLRYCPEPKCNKKLNLQEFKRWLDTSHFFPEHECTLTPFSLIKRMLPNLIKK